MKDFVTKNQDCVGQTWQNNLSINIYGKRLRSDSYRQLSKINSLLQLLLKIKTLKNLNIDFTFARKGYSTGVF